MSATNIILRLRSGQNPIELNCKHDIRVKDGKCSIVVPMHDWWNHTQEHDLRQVEVISNTPADGMVLEFPDEKTRAQFHDWLKETFAKAEEGYKTMWP